ncbi:MAG: DUF1064 domain-containing protein [Candidatus Fimenecus sp.]
MNKYRNIKAIVDGIPFDSRKEANRYCELKLLQRAGQIQNLVLQKEFELLPKQEVDGKVVERAVKYRADFTYEENGKTVVEDTKGVRTPEYILKRKLMLYRYGIQIREV